MVVLTASRALDALGEKEVEQEIEFAKAAEKRARRRRTTQDRFKRMFFLVAAGPSSSDQMLELSKTYLKGRVVSQ